MLANTASRSGSPPQLEALSGLSRTKKSVRLVLTFLAVISTSTGSWFNGTSAPNSVRV